MINFRNLSSTNNNEILECFNQSFSDYSIPFKLSIKQLETKLSTESINKEISIGAFKGNKLIGFVLHGDRIIDEKRIAYNAGTGVVPSERGSRLTTQMYNYILPAFKSKGFDNILLEVISDNIPAIKSYQKIGFMSMRNLDCFKGEITSKKINRNIKIDQVPLEGFEHLSELGEIKPTWQNSKETIYNLGSSVVQVLAYSEDELVGFCLLNSISNRILQIAVKKEMRNKYIGSSLLNYIEQRISKISSIINVDANSEAATKFFESNNLMKSLSQIEMILKITSR